MGFRKVRSVLLFKSCFCLQAPVKPVAAAPAGRKKDSSSSSEESDSEDEQPAKAPATS